MYNPEPVHGSWNRAKLDQPLAVGVNELTSIDPTRSQDNDKKDLVGYVVGGYVRVTVDTSRLTYQMSSLDRARFHSQPSKSLPHTRAPLESNLEEYERHIKYEPPNSSFTK
ncbi:hypothetical protein J6590_046574 [Homalodisca vitripennis]|nr:hypothetical protein J6590_046574 [Homalodisca vitripennis]